MEEMEKIVKNPNSLAYLVYKGIEGAMSAADGVKVGDTSNYGKRLSKDFIEQTFDMVVKKYTEGSIEKRVILNALMSLPWPDTIKMGYEILLGLGKNVDGSYRSTRDTILGSLVKYFGE